MYAGKVFLAELKGLMLSIRRDGNERRQGSICDRVLVIVGMVRSECLVLPR